MEIQFMDEALVDSIAATFQGQELEQHSDKLTRARAITTELLEEAQGIAADLGARADAGTIAAILGSLTQIYLKENKNG